MSNEITRMGEFFDSVAHDYDVVQVSNIDRGTEYYKEIATPLPDSDEQLRMLDLGAGSGLDLVEVFSKLPLLEVDCFDLSEGLLDLLKKRFPSKSDQIHIHLENYLNFDFPESCYDFVLASATLHHFTAQEKTSLFNKLAKTLRSSGTMIIGDFYVEEEISKLFKAHYESFLAKGIDVSMGRYHLDIPTTVGAEIGTLRGAGFEATVCWSSKNYSILEARLLATGT